MTEYFVYKKHKKPVDLQPSFAYLKTNAVRVSEANEATTGRPSPPPPSPPIHPDGSYDYPEQYDLVKVRLNKYDYSYFNDDWIGDH